MKMKKSLRCPIAAPGGMFAAIIGLVGIVMNIINFNLFNLLISTALFMIAAPFVRITFMAHSANDRLDVLEKEIKKLKNE